jgi:GxxExxY protein
MPITVAAPIRRLSQEEFRDIAYSVMGSVFAIHQELGRFFDEKIYKRELAHRHPGVELEVPIQVRHKSFSRAYFLDVLVAGGGLFEFKAADVIVPRHRAQTLNYLHLAGLGHAKLVNVRPNEVEHEFVNTSLHHADRVAFEVRSERWDDDVPGAECFRVFVTELLSDWGTGLELPLYEEALTHFCGGVAQVVKNVEVRMPDHTLGCQKMRMAAPRTAFVLTGFSNSCDSFETHARRLLRHTDLDAILWSNIGLKYVTFTVIR